MKRLREWLESIVFVGMKPSGGQTQPAPAPTSWAGRQRARIDKWISGGPGPADPLYLTNRTWGQKIRAWSVIGVPLVILIAGVGLVLSNILDPPASRPPVELSPAEVAARVLPNLKDLKIDSNHSLDVVEIRIVYEGGTKMVGVVRNLTTQPIALANISCDLTDTSGTQVGAVSVSVEDIPASGTKQFEQMLKQTDTAFVLVREISTK